jgi:dephospho-CoA kinase
MCGAGKSSVTGFLRERGWRVVHFGQVTMGILKERGLEKNEANERAIREELRRVHGPGAYALLLLPLIREALALGPTVLDGLYSWTEYKILMAEFPAMKVIAVYTTRSLRYERLARRPVRPLTPAEAVARDIAEIENLEKGGPIALADYTIFNDGPEEELRAEMAEIVGS